MKIEIVNSRIVNLILKIILYLTIGRCPHEIKAERQLDCNWRGDKNQEGMALRRASLHSDHFRLALEKETTATVVKMAVLFADLHILEVTICIPVASTALNPSNLGYGRNGGKRYEL